VAHQLLIYADDVNLLGGNINSEYEKTDNLLDAGKEPSVKIEN
jgi:hypothetical protein